MDAKELFYQMVSAFNGTNKSQRRPERASPGGPDPEHHWILIIKRAEIFLFWEVILVRAAA
jgi:hypothetical protein